MTQAELNRQARRARKARERDARKADRERLAQLRAHRSAAKKHATVRRREVVRLCQRGRLRAREQAAALRARARAELLKQIDALRADSRRTCEVNKGKARARSVDSLQRANAALEAEKKHQATVRRWTRKTPSVSRTCNKGALCKMMNALESDSEVRNNIPHDLQPVWDRVKSKIKSSARRTRTEAFLEWVQEHSADVVAILDERFQADVAQLARDEAALRRQAGSEGFYRKASDRELTRRASQFRDAAPVPF